MSHERASADHPVWHEIAPEIQRHEFRYPHLMNANFLRRLSRIRRASGVPFRFVSDHRPPERNELAGGATGSAHMGDPCHAVDLRVLNSRERHRLLKAAYAEDIPRIGTYPTSDFQRTHFGANSGTVHLDDSPIHAQEVTWVEY